jgi:hypothetical protein
VRDFPSLCGEWKIDGHVSCASDPLALAMRHLHFEIPSVVVALLLVDYCNTLDPFSCFFLSLALVDFGGVFLAPYTWTAVVLPA